VAAAAAPDVDAIVTWNPQLAEVTALPGAALVFDSADIPGEIIELLVVNTATLADNPALGKALTGAWYETLALMAADTPAGKAAREAMAKASGTDLAGFASQLATTQMFYEPAEAVAFSRDPAGWRIEAMTDRAHSLEADLWHALVLGVRDYLGKNGFPGAILGLSGGIDSALVLAIAVDALGKDRVRTVMMPSPYTADISWIDARDMAARLGVRYDEIAIAPQFEAFKASLAKEFAGLPEDTTEENLQARIRGTLLMALSNKFGSIVLTTGNKSEMATGYCTLYGDMAGGFAVIKDVAKTMVFRLARWRNQHDPYGTGANPIPERIITRPPSAELRADQKDQDSLPEYGVLDAIIERYMENDQSPASIVADGFDRADVDKVVRLIRINEYKRRQAPVGIRVTHRSFGKDWRYPITSKYRA
jgi:NAD+ synthase (glutamine-hydrolysing)